MTLRTVTFDVLGVPKPQGSTRAFIAGGKARITATNKDNGWRDSVARAALQHAAMPFTGPVSAQISFRMPRPKSRPKSHHGWHATSPDIDKLIRSVFDGCTAAGVWTDDRLVAVVTAWACETTEWTGARVTITDLLHARETS